jgi:hypothetical protein
MNVLLFWIVSQTVFGGVLLLLLDGFFPQMTECGI